MPFCSKCGAQVPDNASFCQSCGARRAPAPLQTQSTPDMMTQQTDVQEPLAQYSTPEMTFTNPTPAPVPTPAAPTVASPAITALKRVASSPWMLICTVAVTLSILLVIISSTVSYSVGIESFADMLYDLSREFEMYELEEAADMLYDILRDAPVSGIMGVVGFISAFFSAIPQMLMALGLWLIYANGKSKKPGFKTGGITLLKVLMVIDFVSVCIAFGIVLLALVIGAISCVIAEAPIDVWLIFAIIFIAIALLAAFIIIYYVKIIKLLNAVRNVAKTGKADPSASRFLGVVCWITALVCFFSLLMAMIAAVLAPVSVPFGINVLPVLCSIVSMIGFGVLIFKYRKQMRLCEQASYTL